MKRVPAELMHLIMRAEDAAAMIPPNSVIACSGFISVGDPKAVPRAIARLAVAKNLTVLTGASVGGAIDGDLVNAGLMAKRYPYQHNGDLRSAINAGRVDYADMHLSNLPRFIENSRMHIDFALVECAEVTKRGMIPAASIGATNSYIALADYVILEVNQSLPEEICGIHDSYCVTRNPIPIFDPLDRIGTPYINCPLEKIAAIVITDDKGNCPVFNEVNEVSLAISEHIVRFLKKEVAEGRQPKTLNPLQSGVGNIANSVLSGLNKGGFSGLGMYTEVIQDAAFEMIRDKVIVGASTTAVCLSQTALKSFYDDMDYYKKHILIRPQEITNHPEVVRRLGLIAMNTPIEADIYGNVNSTHIAGSRIMNGIGGSGDFARNAGLSIFTMPSVNKKGNISTVVPMVSHVDHTEHDVMVLATEQGLADLRWKSPRERAKVIIENCAHPSYRPLLREYFRDALKFGGHIPHNLDTALSWYRKFQTAGSML